MAGLSELFLQGGAHRRRGPAASYAVQAGSGPLTLADLLHGGVAGGKPVAAGYTPSASPLASMAGRHLNAVQQERRALREHLLAQLGFDPGTAVYGAHANVAARRALRHAGSGLGRGAGLARGGGGF